MRTVDIRLLTIASGAADAVGPQSNMPTLGDAVCTPVAVISMASKTSRPPKKEVRRVGIDTAVAWSILGVALGLALGLPFHPRLSLKHHPLLALGCVCYLESFDNISITLCDATAGPSSLKSNTEGYFATASVEIMETKETMDIKGTKESMETMKSIEP